MKKIIKLIFIIFLFLFFISILSGNSWAREVECESDKECPSGYTCNLSYQCVPSTKPRAVLSLPWGGGTIQFPSLVPFSDLGDLITTLLRYLFPFAGLILFAYLIIGGFSFLTSGGDPKGMEAAKGKVTNAIVGFIIIFVAYWVVQIFEFIFKIQVF